MNSLLRLRKSVRFESVRWQTSREMPDVRFAVCEPSLQKRIDLTQKLHELTLKNEFLASGKEMEQLELALAELLVQKTLIEWGLAAIEGLFIDGKPATPGTLIEAGPEPLMAEIAMAIRRQCWLDEEERKN
jgi:hypothetical protein